tara:strand:+ start:1017 stop:1469 length:453 start_codon:yes stop_codon:yes gene_type:complete
MKQSRLKLIKKAVSVFTLLDEEKPPKVVFTTQRDNKVDDKVCVELAGIAFEIDDPLRPVIPIDTHPNCRCYYVDQSTGEIVTDISSSRIKERGMPSKKLNDIQRIEELTLNKKNLTKKKIDLIIKTMEDNEAWQSKSAKAEKILKWLKQI